MKKVLITTTVSGFVPQFEMNNVKLLQNMGYEVHYASNFHNVSYGVDNHRLDATGIVLHQIDYTRSPFQIKNNRIAYGQLKALLQKEEFALLHCHTPVASVLSRLAVKHSKQKNIKVIYTAHGFHFYKGASWKYWLLFYTVEKSLAKKTDVLITMNEEDYTRAKKFCRRNKTKVEYIPGAGIDTMYWNGKTITETEQQQLRLQTRKRLGLQETEIAFLSVGELIHRKNHRMVIRSLSFLVKQMKQKQNLSFHYYICGHGILQEELEKLVKKEKMEQYVTFLGYQDDIRTILFGMDWFIFPSVQEGMPMALLEAVTFGLPVIASDIRGNRDVIRGINEREEKQGYLFSSEETLREILRKIIVEKELKSEKIKTDMTYFDNTVVQKKMKQIYEDVKR